MRQYENYNIYRAITAKKDSQHFFLQNSYCYTAPNTLSYKKMFKQIIIAKTQAFQI